MKKLLLIIGFVLISVISVSAGQVLLDHVEGAWLDGATYKINPNSPIEFHIRLINDDAQPITSLTNGFQVYGPSSFTPANGYSVLDPGILIFQIIIGPTNDGLGADTVGFTSGFFGNLPVGFDDVVYVITTGNIAEGETLCLDSCFFPPSGSWKWAAGVFNIFPSWDGPHCFVAESSCETPVFDYCIDSLTMLNCYNPYLFSAHNDYTDNSTIRYAIIEGPGYINETTGLWTYTPLETDYGTTQTLTVKTYNIDCPSENYNLCSMSLTFIDSLVIGDIDFSCSIDIADLVYMVAFMFQGGPPPPNYDSFDVNGDGKFDITDLVYLVNFMFNDGPPPVE